MANYEIEDSRWKNRVSSIEAYIASHEDLGTMEVVLNWNIEQGTNNPEQRKRYWDNLTNMFANVDDSPLGATGRQSTLPVEVQTALATLCKDYEAGHRALYASSTLFGRVESKRGATSQPYGSEDNYATAMVTLFADRMKAAYKAYENDGFSDKAKTIPAKSWNGKLSKDGLPTIVIPEEQDGGKA